MVSFYRLGVKDTPRSTSPKPAVLSVAKLSPLGGIGPLASNLSVITTNLFGSAP